MVHNVSYFAPEGRAATDALGCKGMWMGYFGMRAASLGAVTAETVIAIFVSFSPAMARRAIPDVWAIAGLARQALGRRRIDRTAARCYLCHCPSVHLRPGCMTSRPVVPPVGMPNPFTS
jgi:hypothetical protein